MTKIKAEFDKMEVHKGAEYSEDPQVHRPAVTDEDEDIVLNDGPKSAVDIERNPKPKTPEGNEDVLSEPLQYVVSVPMAIEKMEALLDKVEESIPGLKTLVDEVRVKVDEIERQVMGDAYIEKEQAEGEAPTVSTPEATEQFASGDRVIVELEKETYEGQLTDKNEDGTWEVQTDNQVVLHRVPAEDIHIGDKKTLMLPASKQEIAMKELEKLAATVTAAIEAKSTVEAASYKIVVFNDDGTYHPFQDKAEAKAFLEKKQEEDPEDGWQMGSRKDGVNIPAGEEEEEGEDATEELRLWILNDEGLYNETRRVDSAEDLEETVKEIFLNAPDLKKSIKVDLNTIDWDQLFEDVKEEDVEASLQASVFEVVKELDLGGGYIARIKKGKKAEKEEKPKEEKGEGPKVEVKQSGKEA